MKLIHQVIKIRSIRTSPFLINKLNNMKTKELKIQVPEGYEIDKENSTFERIRFKPIKKDITYEDVCENSFFSDNGFYISAVGEIEEIVPLSWKDDKNNATNKKQLEKILALNQLLNIAEYYNRNTAELNVRYRICYDSTNYYYKVVPYAFYNFTYSLEALFNNEEDALAVIDNPNFREILDTIYKD